MQIHLKVKFKLFPDQVYGLVSAVERSREQPPSRDRYPVQTDYLGALIAYATLLDYERKLRTSSTMERWPYKDATRPHVYSMPTVVAMALWRFLRQSGPHSDAEQSLFSQLDQQLVNGHLLRPGFDPRPLQLT